MAGGYKFAPLNVRAVYQNDGSAKSTFLAEVAKMTNDASRMFKDFSNEARMQLDAALSVKRNNTGSLDLGVDELRQAAAAQQARATAAREVAAATALAAREEGDYSQKARLAVAATQALAIEEERAAAQAHAHAQAAEQVQERLNRQASATDLVVAATKRGTSETGNVINGIRAQRVAFTQLGQQLQDVTVQLQMGTNATTIFVQQVPQMAFALSGLTESTNKFYSGIGKVGTFLAGPWGAAIFAATAVLGPYIAELFRATDALDEVGKAAQDAMQKLQQSVANASNFTDALTTSQKSLVTAMGRVGRAQRDILETQKAINSLSGRAGSSQTVTALSNRLTQLKAERAAAQKDLDSAKADLENIRGLGATVRIQEANRKALNPDKPKKPRADHSAERAARAAMRLGEFGEDAGKKIANIRDSFADIPPEVERVNKATRELDDIISDLNNRKPEGFEAMVAEAEALKRALPDEGFRRAMREITADAQQQVQYQMLMLQGRDGEAQALQQIYQIEQNLGPLRRDQKDQIIATGIAMQRVNEEMQRAQEIQSVYLGATRDIRSEVEAILGGYGKLGDLGNTFKRAFQQIQGKVLTEQIFGDLFRDMDRYVKEKTGIGSSVDKLKMETERAGGAAGNFADAINAATQRITGVGTGSAGVVTGPSATTVWGNMKVPDSIRRPGYDFDPNAQIVVEGKKPGAVKNVNDLTPQEYFRQMSQGMAKALTSKLDGLFGTKFLGNFSSVLGGVLEGKMTTGTGFGAVLGGLKELKGLPEGLSKGLGKAFQGAQTGAAVAGIGNALGLKLSNTGAQIGGAIGSMLPIPGGQIIGAIAGGLIGKLFGSTKKGYAVATNGGVSTGGNSTQAANAGNSAGALNDSLNSIARAFGTSLGNYAVSIGSRSSGWISVSASGSSQVGDKGWKKRNAGGDLIYDGKDMEAALRAALKNAIEDGAIQGIRAGSKRLLSVGSNIDAQVEKALKFENVFKTLKSIKDPLGAALDDLNKEFQGLIDIFKEAGASAEEMAQLEELYGIKRKEALEQAAEAMLSPLKNLLQSLNIGSDYYSLRDREKAALDIYNPLKARVAAGDTTAYEAFAEAAQNLIAIDREIYGSTTPFFDLLKEVTDLTKGQLTSQQQKIDDATGSDSPFSQLASQQQATTSAIDNQTSALIEALGGRLDLINGNLIAALKASAANGNSVNYSALFTARGAW